MNRLLITGATGFIGRHAVELAASRGLEVHAVSMRAPREPAAGVTYHQLDLLDDARATRALVGSIAPTQLLHLAWYAVPGKYWTSSENYRWVAATLLLADAFAAAGGRRLVAAGSCAEYDWRHGFCSEGITPNEPATPYGIAKDSVRRLLEPWSRAAGVPFAWGRIFFAYGPGEPRERLVPSVITSLLHGETARTTGGTQVRDFLHVHDVAAAFLTLVESEAEGAFNVAAGEPVAVRDVVTRIGAQLGASERLAIGALPQRDEEPLLVADTRRLRALGWAPRFTLDEGLRHTIAWWRANP